MRMVSIIIGAVLILAAINWTDASGNAKGSNLWPLLKNDFEPQQGSGGNFLAYFAAIVIIGTLGYVPELRSVSVLLLAIVIAILLMKAVKQNPNFLQSAAATLQQKAS